MALIAMAVWDTVENKRTKFTVKTVESLFNTVDFSKHRLIISDNGSCNDTKDFYGDLGSCFPEDSWMKNVHIFQNYENIGTAAAINKAWASRLPGENAIKMDNDVVINYKGWVEEMEEAIRRDPEIGQVGLKRKDCWEEPYRDDFYKSELIMLPHQPGERWMVAEKVNHVMGTCVLHSSALLDKIGYLWQPKLYGFDDSFMSRRSILAGFKNVFLNYIDIDHIDPGGGVYQQWKSDHASAQWQEYAKALNEFNTGKRPLYYNPFQL